jgi:hypothetical protein
VSLKAFHIFFITLCVLMSAALGAWGVNDYLRGGDSQSLVLGVLFFVTGAVLLVYGIRFWKKMKELRV